MPQPINTRQRLPRRPGQIPRFAAAQQWGLLRRRSRAEYRGAHACRISEMLEIFISRRSSI